MERCYIYTQYSSTPVVPPCTLLLYGIELGYSLLIRPFINEEDKEQRNEYILVQNK